MVLVLEPKLTYIILKLQFYSLVMRHKGASRIEWLGFNSSSFSIVEKSS